MADSIYLYNASADEWTGPYATIGFARAAADGGIFGPGDIVEYRAETPGSAKIFEARMTIADSGVEGNPITIRGRAGDAITISGNVYKTASDFIGPDGNGEYYIESITADPNVLWDGDTRLTEGSVGSLGDGTWGYDSVNDRVYFKPADDLSLHNINIPVEAYAGYLSSADYLKISNLQFEGCRSATGGVIYGVTSSSIEFEDVSISKPNVYTFRAGSGSDNLTFTNPVIDAGGKTAMRLVGNDVTISNPICVNFGDGIRIEGNRCTVNGGDLSSSAETASIYAVRIVAGSDHVIDGTRIHDIKSGTSNNIGISADCTSATIKNCVIDAMGTRGVSAVSGNITVLNSKFKNIWNGLNYGAGGEGRAITVSDTVTNLTVVGNLFYKNWVAFEGGDANTTIAFNTFREQLVNHIDVYSLSAHSTDIHFNTIYHKPALGIGINGGHCIILRENAGGAVKATITDNIIYIDCVMDNSDGVIILDTDADVTLDNNRYYYQANGFTAQILRWVDTAYDVGSFAAWEAFLNFWRGVINNILYKIYTYRGKIIWQIR